MSNTYQSPIANTLDDQKNLIFYQIMKYDIPRHSNYFLFEKKGGNIQEEIIRAEKFPPDASKYSWDHKNPYIEEYIKHIQKFGWLYRSLPFVQSIYLCNSITFNALHENSDIDVFIIAKKGALWRARLRSAVMFTLCGLKRGIGKSIKKKFCLSFYVTQDHQNLYNIMLPQNDIYFIYRLAHLVPLYQETKENIYKHNLWIESALPNFPGRHCIDIGIDPYTGKNRYKRINEFIFGGYLGQAIEFLIKLIRIPILLYKTKRLEGRGWGIIINDNILKFHMDIRKKIHLLYMMYKKKMNKK